MAKPDRLPDRYRPVRLLGEGGAGRVWLVEDQLRDGQRVAIKEWIAATPERIEEFRREFSFLRQIHHPSLVAAYDLEFDLDRGAPLLAMEWIEGQGLLEAIREQPEQLPKRVAEALQAVAFLHDLGIVHCNLKPGNLRVRKTPRLGARLVVLDFGLALRDQTAQDARGATANTLPYLAPELLDGGTHGAATDLYALGVVIYESVFGRPPIRYDGDLASFVEAVRSGRRARPGAPDGFPPGLNEWLEQMLAPDPADRPASASEALNRWNVACGTEFPLETDETRTVKLAQLAVYSGNLKDALVLAGKAKDQGLQLGDRRLQLFADLVRAQALVRCGRTVEAVTLLSEPLDSPDPRIDPVIIEGARLAAIEAGLAAPRPEWDRLAASLSEAIARAEALGEPDTLLWAMTLEIERLAAQDGDASLQRWLKRYELFAAREGSWRQPWFEDRVTLARARNRLARGRAVQAREILEPIIDREREQKLDSPAVQAEAWSLLVQVARALKNRQLETEAREKGRHKLSQAEERIADDKLAQGLSERKIFKPLREAPSIDDSPINRRLVALYEMIRALNSESDPDQLLETILDMAMEVVGADRGMILLRDEATGEFSVRLARNVDPDTVADGHRFSRHIVAEAGKGRSVVALDAQDDERFMQWRSVSLNSIQSLMCAPLRSRGQITGAVYVDSREGGQPFDMGSLRFLEAFANHAALALENARQFASLHIQNLDLRAAAEQRARFGNMVGNSDAMRQVFASIEQVSASELPVLIQGESGTGKELVAQAIHYNGSRRERAFISENCASIPDSLLQSELFGHVRGAYTGADHDRQGLFEQADGGTLFLDEVGDMSATMQAQLLRAIQEGEIRRVGSEAAVKVDVRLISATHRDLEAEVAAGRFRQDLLYRMQVLLVHLPALRDRTGDIPLLTAHFLDRIARARNRKRVEISTTALDRLERQRWPGNIRQFENVLQRLTLLAGDGIIDTDLLDATSQDSPKPVEQSLSVSERDRIVEALERVDGNRTRAARLLGISRATIYRKLREFGL